MNQVEEHQPPPNPAKLTDTRAQAYIAEFGNESWELDALDPATLAELIRGEIEALIERDEWEASTQTELDGRENLRDIARHYDSVVDFLETR